MIAAAYGPAASMINSANRSTPARSRENPAGSAFGSGRARRTGRCRPPPTASRAARDIPVKGPWSTELLGGGARGGARRRARRRQLIGRHEPVRSRLAVEPGDLGQRRDVLDGPARRRAVEAGLLEVHDLARDVQEGDRVPDRRPGRSPRGPVGGHPQELAAVRCVEDHDVVAEGARLGRRDVLPVGRVARLEVAGPGHRRPLRRRDRPAIDASACPDGRQEIEPC